MRLLHIVPRVSPAIDGVGDFAVQLGANLKESHGIDSRYLACGDLASAERFRTEARRIEHDHLLLHYSGYGYDRRGAPRWLLEGLEEWGRSGGKLSVFFHELWVLAFPWQRPFYSVGLQKRMVRELQQLASHSFTSTPLMKRLLDVDGGATILTPIPSTIPPAAQRTKTSDRLTAIIFGQEHTRQRSVAMHRELILREHRAGRLGQLKLVGTGASERGNDHILASRLVPGAVVSRADLSPESIAREFAGSDLALSFYPLNFLTKSTTIMAAFASGCPVVLPSLKASEPFEPRAPVLAWSGEPLERSELERAGRASRQWYEAHAGWPVLSAAIAAALQGQGAPEPQA